MSDELDTRGLAPKRTGSADGKESTSLKSSESGDSELIAEELKWYREVYKGNRLPELTPRALITGLVLGIFMVALNVYMGLKTGWGEGGSIIAAILGFTIFFFLRTSIGGLYISFGKTIERNRFLYRLFRPLLVKLSILENNIIQTTASAAGSIGNIVNVIPALILLGYELTWWQIFAWIFSTSFLGVLFAVPLRRQMVVMEKLTFPTGTACAETLKTLHGDVASTGSEENSSLSDRLQKAREAGLRRSILLLITGTISAIITFLRDAVSLLPDKIYLPVRYSLNFRGIPLELSPKELTMGFSLSPMMLAIGLLVGMRVTLSLLIGALITWLVIVPILISRGIIVSKLFYNLNLDFSYITFIPVISTGHIHYHDVTNWTMWAGTSVMVAAGLVSMVFKWPIIVRALKTIGGLGTSGTVSSEEEANSELVKLGQLELPFYWWLSLLALASAFVTIMMWLVFSIPLWMGILAVILSYILALVAVRSTGETDINPVGAMGHVTQIAYGVMSSRLGLSDPTVVNLMAAGVTAAGASEAADMMQDLKTGYLVGGTPRRQMIAQFIGVMLGAIAAVFIFEAIRLRYGIATEAMPAPAAVVWKGFAELVAKGAQALPPGALESVIVGLIIGVILGVMENFKGLRKYAPSPIGLGIGMIIPAYYSVTMFIGALLKFAIDKYYGEKAVEDIDYPVGSGALAGEGIMGAGISIWSMIVSLLK